MQPIIFLNVLDMMALSDDDKSYFRVDPEFLTGRCPYLINISLIGIYWA